MKPAVLHLLQHGAIPDKATDPDAADGWFDAFVKYGAFISARPDLEDHALRDDWRSVSDELLAAWVQDAPGTRPWGWWAFDAPRWSGPYPERCRDLAWSLARLAEPRQRIGGIGDPEYLHLNTWPAFDRGIPTAWVGEWAVQYYAPKFTGRAIDPNDPPRFESEAGYLRRHGLLSPAEERRLTPAAFEPEQVTE